MRTVCDYVHLNPVRAKLLKGRERLLSYPWSSLGWYLAAREHRPGWMRVDRLLGEHGIGSDDAEGREAFEGRMEARRLEDNEPEALRALRRGWVYGSGEFRERMLERVEGELRPSHSGSLKVETAQSKAERIVREELKRLGWRERELVERRKSDPEKVAIGGRLRRETTLTLKGIAERLSLGSPKSANAHIHRWLKRHAAGGKDGA